MNDKRIARELVAAARELTATESGRKPRMVARDGLSVTTDIRHPVYECGDKIGDIRDAIRSDPHMKADR